MNYQKHSHPIVLALFMFAVLFGLARAAEAPAPFCDICVAPAERALQRMLTRYQELADNGGWPQWQIGKKIEMGANDKRIPTLRQMLTITGDYPAASGKGSHSPVYDETLVGAVQHFQSRHGLNADGQLGKSTQAALAVPVNKRITQMVATLARMKQRPITEDEKFILINLPAYTLYGVEKGKTNVSMRVIVGNRQNHTPLFENKVTDIVFNPPWSVPSRIARNELLPKLRANPDYFIRAGFTVTQDGEAVDPREVNTEEGDFSFRQKPGMGNALGKIKFNLPDNDNIYLHSTANPKLFAQEDRAMSHGCVRLEQPRTLAHFVLAAADGWNVEKVNSAYDSATSRSVKVKSVPVYLVYWTAWVDAAGQPHFFNDVYNKDAHIEEAKLLKQVQPIQLALQ